MKFDFQTYLSEKNLDYKVIQNQHTNTLVIEKNHSIDSLCLQNGFEMSK